MELSKPRAILVTKIAGNCSYGGMMKHTCNCDQTLPLCCAYTAEASGVQRQQLHKGNLYKSTGSLRDGLKKAYKSERQPTHLRLFLKNILFFAKEALGASVRSMACVQSSCRRQNHRTSPWVNWGPHPCLPRRNVWGSYSAAVAEHGLKQWAQWLSWKCWKGMLLYSMWLSTWYTLLGS